MDQQNWVTQSVLLFALPVAATTVAFAYESGYAYHFGIPMGLITINWTAATLAFLALTTVFQLVASWGYLLAHQLAKWSPLFTTKSALLLSAFVVLDGVLLVRHGLDAMPFCIGVAITAGFQLIDIVIRVIGSLPSQGFWQRFRVTSTDGENADPLRSTFNTYALLGIWVIVFLAIAWSTGYSGARDQRSFLMARLPQEQVVLRRYGDMFVMAGLDRGKKTVSQNLTFQAVVGDPSRVFFQSDVGPLVASP